MNIIIHACPERMWYVEEFLLPELRRQEAGAVTVWNDSEGRGNLKACMDAFAACSGDGDTWHLQDDVLPRRDFAERIRALEDFSGVVCGFVDEAAGPDFWKTGCRPMRDMWYSFPCVRIPDAMARGCAEWVRAGADRSCQANVLIGQNRGDDWFFLQYAAKTHPEGRVMNLAPCLVEHVDRLLGGSMACPDRDRTARAAYWDQPERVRVLEWKIRRRFRK